SSSRIQQTSQLLRRLGRMGQSGRPADRAAEMKESRQGDSRLFWIVVLALFLLTRIPAMSQYLSIDNVNLAFSLEKFDPRDHQPQPPGYPLFVVFNRIVNVVFHDAEKTFALTGLLVSALSLVL